jgi:hypothetical protein
VQGKGTKETDDVAGAARAAADPRSLDELATAVAGAPGVPAQAENAAPEAAGVGEEAEDNGAEDGASPVEAEGDEEQGPPPAEVAELAAGCVRFIGARYGVTLDFEPDTLSFVDQWLRDARAEVSRRPQTAELVQSSAGAYLGEVMRRTFGGTWVVSGETSEWRLCLSSVYCAFNPIGMVREALLLEAAEGWHAHFELDPGEREGIEARLAALPEVEDDEFYAPSTRFDVTEIVVAALRAEMQARGLGSVVFAPGDYNLA